MHARSLARGMLRNREGVSVRVFEPRHLVAARSGPDAGLVLAGEAVALEFHAVAAQRFGGGGDVRNVPSEDRPRPWRKVDFDDADGDAVRVEDHGEAVVADEA